MRVFRLAAVVALLAGPAYAQALPNLNLLPELKSMTPEEKEAEAARDKAYKESLKKIPDAKAPSDPWGTVRSGDAAKTSASNGSTPKTSIPKTSGAKASNSKTAASVKPKAKTGTDAN
jgi:hypothetical protein